MPHSNFKRRSRKRFRHNTTNAGVTMSINLVTLLSFCWYFLVRTEIIPLAITPVRDAAPNGMLTGALMNVANVATLDIPVATLIQLEQAFNHVSRFNILLCRYMYLKTYAKFTFCIKSQRHVSDENFLYYCIHLAGTISSCSV